MTSIFWRSHGTSRLNKKWRDLWVYTPPSGSGVHAAAVHVLLVVCAGFGEGADAVSNRHPRGASSYDVEHRPCSIVDASSDVSSRAVDQCVGMKRWSYSRTLLLTVRKWLVPVATERTFSITGGTWLYILALWHLTICKLQSYLAICVRTRGQKTVRRRACVQWFYDSFFCETSSICSFVNQLSLSDPARERSMLSETLAEDNSGIGLLTLVSIPSPATLDPTHPLIVRELSGGSRPHVANFLHNR